MSTRLEMSATTKQTILLCIIAAILASALIVAGFVRLQTGTHDEYMARVETVLDDAIREVVEIRGLDVEHVQVEVVTLDWVRENWGKGYAEADMEGILREEETCKTLLMIPENASLYEAKIDWAAATVAAVWQGKIYVVKEHFDPWDSYNAERTLVHELTHIVQNKYFHVADVPTYDGGKARSSLIEGDACLMEDAYRNKTGEHAFSVNAVDGQLVRASGEEMQLDYCRASVPESISRLNYFPYEYGLDFAKALFSTGSWETVNQAYVDVPATTEQIVHPEKYFDGEKAKKADAPDMAEESWKKLRNDQFGEYFIRIMLENWITVEKAQKAAEGWGGDNFTYYEREASYLFTWNVTWDSAEEALEFHDSFQEMMNTSGAESRREGFWMFNGRYLSIMREESSTLIVGSSDETVVTGIFEGT